MLSSVVRSFRTRQQTALSDLLPVEPSVNGAVLPGKQSTRNRYTGTDTDRVLLPEREKVIPLRKVAAWSAQGAEVR